MYQLNGIFDFFYLYIPFTPCTGNKTGKLIIQSTDIIQ